ncbi:hypothetical protein Micbo1qcDRAFT_11810 [Microdochium bolleyi]|uniref:Uncharacterized protein n=1 Tax=Microdochium bolleyi TaxID=196109 RepID=A0A136IWR6_9PEZI|nr:hypothetical protein Micbo1qcDRAFT_11810 [Microdochium bolleyi]
MVTRARKICQKNFQKKKVWIDMLTVDRSASGIEPDAGVEPATLRLRVSRSTD